jgi:SAM-dependent methyltransferase
MAIGRALFAALALLACMPLVAQHGEQHMHRRFDDAEKWSKVFDDPARDAWQKPAEIIAALRLQEDASVADIGSGTGYFAVRLARAVPRGHVYGADVEQDMVRFLTDRAARERLPNLTSHVAGEHGPNLPAQVDLALVVDTYHHIPQRSRYFERLKSALRSGGRIAIIDFKLDSPTGPPVKHRIPPDQVKAEMERAGYKLVEQPDLLPYQYFLVFAPR